MVAPAWPLRTERLLLRPFAPDDLDALYAIQPDESVARWLYNEPRTLEFGRYDNRIRWTSRAARRPQP
jgi:RimJ/RimL family protein N-acetyltransferase